MFEESLIWIISLLNSTLRVSVPLILAALAGLFSERAGVVDIGLEGKMLAAAFASATAAYMTGSPWVGLLAGMLVAMAFSLLHSVACVTYRGDQVISGVAINILCAGLTVIVGIALFQQGGTTPNLPTAARFLGRHFESLEQGFLAIPLVGRVFVDLVAGHNMLVYIAFAVVPLSAWLIYKTRFGLRLRAVGESPKAVDTAGISVEKLRYMAQLINGLLCGIAGTYLSTAQSAGFIANMTAGKGFLALAALIFGKWKPVPTMCACLLFAFADALQTRLQGSRVPMLDIVIPVQFIQMIPYVLTVFILAGFVGKSIAPKAIGKPYVKER